MRDETSKPLGAGRRRCCGVQQQLIGAVFEREQLRRRGFGFRGLHLQSRRTADPADRRMQRADDGAGHPVLSEGWWRMFLRQDWVRQADKQLRLLLLRLHRSRHDDLLRDHLLQRGRQECGAVLVRVDGVYARRSPGRFLHERHSAVLDGRNARAEVLVSVREDQSFANGRFFGDTRP